MHVCVCAFVRECVRAFGTECVYCACMYGANLATYYVNVYRFGGGGGGGGGDGGGGGGGGGGIGGDRGISWDDSLLRDSSIFMFIEKA